MSSPLGDIARTWIIKAGGLAHPSDLARRYGINRSTMHEWASDPDFPEPVQVLGRSPVYLTCEVDGWVRHHRPARAARHSHKEVK